MSLKCMSLIILGFWELGYKKQNFVTSEIWRVVLGVWEEVIVVMFYGTVAWDPWLIVAQILCLQCLYYLSLGVFLTFLVGTRVSRMSLVYFFDYAAVTTSTVTGWCVIASFLLSSLAGWEFHFTFFFLIVISFLRLFGFDVCGLNVNLSSYLYSLLHFWIMRN